jgi:hypothetical protein
MRPKRVSGLLSPRDDKAGRLVFGANESVCRKSFLPLLLYRFVPHLGSLLPRLRERM